MNGLKEGNKLHTKLRIDNEVIPINSLYEMNRMLTKYESWASVFYFKKPLVIRQDTQTIRDTVNALTWWVKMHENFIEIRPKKRPKQHEAQLISWDDIESVYGEFDSNTYD